MEQLDFYWMDFHEIICLSSFHKSAKKIQVSLKSDKNNGYFTWRPIYIFFVSNLTQFFLEWEIFQIKLVEKIKTHILCSIIPPPNKKNLALYEIMWKNVETCGPWQYGMCTLQDEYLKLQAHTQNCFSTATLVAWMHLSIMLCIHCLSLFLLFCSKLSFSCLNVSVYFSLPSCNFSFASLSFLPCFYSPHSPPLASCYAEFESGSISLIFIFCLFS